MGRTLKLTPAERDRWAQLVARGVSGAQAVRTVVGPARAAEMTPDVAKSAAYRLRAKLGERIAELRAEAIAQGEGWDKGRRPLDLGELSVIASEVTSALAAAIRTGEALALNPSMVLALRREIGAHLTRVARLPEAAEAPAEVAEGAGVAEMLARTAPCGCGGLS